MVVSSYVSLIVRPVVLSVLLATLLSWVWHSVVVFVISVSAVAMLVVVNYGFIAVVVILTVVRAILALIVSLSGLTLFVIGPTVEVLCMQGSVCVSVSAD